MSATALPPARWWHALENKKVACTLCPRECHIPNGSRGFCFVRANVEGRLELTTYGRSSGFCIDPIEKKPLNHFLPGTPILSFGTAGCNLGCKFCQNWDISKSREMDTLAHLALPDAIVQAALKHGCRSLAFTYNDPVIWAEYAIDIAKVARANGLKTVAVTAGYISAEARGEFYEHMDAANVDLKGFTDLFYSKLCQVNLEPILDTLKFLKRETNTWFELTNLMIPGENDTTDETKAMCQWIVENLGPDVPVHFTAFHPDFKMRDTPPTPPETLVKARQIALAAGIRYAYVGNVNDVENQSTYCHACHKLLIQRDWYELGEYHLRGNACSHCGATIPGLFDPAGPGTWGRKRQAVAIGETPAPTQNLITLTTPAAKAPSAIAPAPPSGGLNILNAPARIPATSPFTLTAAPAAPHSSPAPKTDFTPEQQSLLLAYARAAVEATLLGTAFTARLPTALATAPAYGIFVSLHRSTQLRSCKGQWSPAEKMLPMSQLLATVARDAATEDPRFPRITAAELPYLTLEISLLHSPQMMAARGEERLRAVHVGTHGLLISHPNGRGLLLPHVPVECKWDTQTFLEQTCQKAGLPPHAWKDDQAALMTFCALKLTSPAPTAELNLAELGNPGLSQLYMAMHQMLTHPAQSSTLPTPAQAPILHQIHPEELGLCLQTASGVTGTTIAPNASLLALARSAASSLASLFAQRGISEPVQTMTFLWQPLALSAADYPHRHQNLAHCAILAQVDDRWSLAIPQPNVQADKIAEALASVQLNVQAWQQDRAGRIRITAFNAFHCHNRPVAQSQPSPAQTDPALRQPFRAGTFYPADPAEARAEVTAHFAAALPPSPPKTCRAIMLPHAGWRFCGSTIAKTLAAIDLPKTVIILSPKHTHLGPVWSLANHAAWQLPGSTIPLAAALAQRLHTLLPQLPCESQAHLQEHGIEVLLPFLHHRRPDLQILPIVLGPCNGDLLGQLATSLATLLQEARAQHQEPPLLIISSDMNHFADEAETRRRDTLALNALQTGNPLTLFQTCQQHDISMCGILPAVTVLQTLLRDTPHLPPRPRLIDYTTSAATTGDTSRVVGYAGVIIE